MEEKQVVITKNFKSKIAAVSANKKSIIDDEESMRLLATAIEKSSHPFLVGHPDGRIVLFNPAYCQLTGYSEDELSTMTWNNDLTPPEWLDVQAGAIKKVVATRNPTRYEKEYLRKDGSRVSVEVFIHPFMRDDDVRIQYFYAFVTDITERKRTETALRHSEAKFSKVFLFNPDPISITTVDEGRYIEVNDAYLQFTGYERDEIIGRNSLEVGIWAVPGDREIQVAFLNEHGSISGIETKFRKKSGEVRTTLMSMEIIDMDGQPHILAIIKDITERKQFEEALRASEERFSKAFNASPITVCISTLEDGRYIDVNDSYCNVSGYSREELLGNSSLDMGTWANPQDREQIKQIIKEKGSVRDREFLFCIKSGEIRLGLYSAEKIDIKGQPCLLTTFVDITERKRMESEMTRLDRLDLVGRMAAIIGHEIRNPMTTVRGFLQMLKGREKYEEEGDVFNLMIEELDRANAIITEFLSLTKDKMVQLDLKNLNTIVSNIFPLLQAHAMDQDKNIEVRLEKVPDLLLDEKEIRQLMLNMVRNGLYAMTPGGTLTIRTFMKDYNPVLSIQDQGHGMNSEVVAKLGTPFFTTKDEGTGLGMAVCYGIIERHKADIEIETSTSGTRFNILFPS